MTMYLTVLKPRKSRKEARIEAEKRKEQDKRNSNESCTGYTYYCFIIRCSYSTGNHS
jgi:hypothetical protein